MVRRRARKEFAPVLNGVGKRMAGMTFEGLLEKLRNRPQYA